MFEIILTICAACPVLYWAVGRDCAKHGVPREFARGEWHIIPPPSAEELKRTAQAERLARRGLR